ncbi:glycosyltransferase family 4 protein [Puniceicoccaceae bacterium K14]|nr:glycosyltransferase family 4 protein [Puniceicoccaceae bacterium K14]
MDPAANSVSILLPISGIMSEIWVKRQAESFNVLTPRLISWECQKNPAWKLNNLDSTLNVSWNEPRKPLTKFLDKLGIDASSSGLKTNDALNHLLCGEIPSAAICHFGWTAAKSYRFLRSKNIPYYVIFHGLDLSIPRLKGSYLKNLRNAMCHASGCIIVGSHMKKILLDICPTLDQGRIHQIPCGAPLDKFCNRPQPQRQKDEPLKLITVGRLVQGKGIDLCIEALKLVRSQNANVTLSVIGDGDQKEHLEGISKSHDLDKIVSFLGRKTPEEIAHLLSNHHVLIQPSRNATNGWVEGFGVSITEAMASALPVIASKTGGIPDQVQNEKNGFLFESEDYDSLADRIMRYQNDELLRFSHGTSARNQSKNFDAKNLSRQLENIILKKLR